MSLQIFYLFQVDEASGCGCCHEDDGKRFKKGVQRSKRVHMVVLLQ